MIFFDNLNKLITKDVVTYYLKVIQQLFHPLCNYTLVKYSF
jgi:hypothetical protein